MWKCNKCGGVHDRVNTGPDDAFECDLHPPHCCLLGFTRAHGFRLPARKVRRALERAHKRPGAQDAAVIERELRGLLALGDQAYRERWTAMEAAWLSTECASPEPAETEAVTTT